MTKSLVNLNKFLAAAGVTSRRGADALIKAGKVKVNNKVVLEPFFKVDESDYVVADGRQVTLQEKVYIVLNKPKGVITTASDERGRVSVLDLVDISIKVHPIGRLDKDTTGVLILTNDGDLTQKLSHPKFEVSKTYRATLNKSLDTKSYQALKKGVRLEDGIAEVDSVSLKDKVVTLTIHSGKNRVIRRLFEALGFHVKSLERILYAGLSSKGLKVGKWRRLSKSEVRQLQKRPHG